jgi:uncharacterized membrane protein YdjX (TVP38/TMEM64 family)
VKQKKKITSLLVVIALLIFVVYLFQRGEIQVDSQQIREFIRSFGLLGPIVFMILNALSIVFAPLTALPFWVASLALYGFWPTLFYIFISFQGGAIANFWIARQWGRPAVRRFVGKKGLENVDEMTEVVGLPILLLIRLIGGASSDYVAYASGLTNMKFKPYFLITLFASPPATFLNVYIIDQALDLKPAYFVFGIVGYLLSIFVPLWVYQRQRKKLNSQ